jgi:hypothetical protein
MYSDEVSFFITVPDQSHRSAIIGSTFVARRAGIQQVDNAANVSNRDAATKTTGSFASCLLTIFGLLVSLSLIHFALW